MNPIKKIGNIDFTWTIKNVDHQRLLIIPLIVAGILGVIVMTIGVPLGLEFAGGTYLEARNVDMPEDVDAGSIEAAIQGRIGGTVDVHIFNGRIEIEGFRGDGEPFEREQLDILEEILENDFNIRIESWDVQTEMGAGITAIFARRAQYSAFIAAVAISIVIFIAFRNFTVIGGILSVVALDLVAIFGIMALVGIPFTHASLAGILLIIGYAIDDNVLLYNRVLKRKGSDVRVRASSAMKTGLTMAFTSGIALLALNIATTSPALFQISAVMIIGIAADSLNTWFFNAGIIIRHTVKHEKSGGGQVARI